MIVLKTKSSYLFLEEEGKCSRELGLPVESVQVESFFWIGSQIYIETTVVS